MSGDTSAIDAAVIATLANDVALGFGPDGVFWEVARPGLTQYVIVSQLAHEDEYVLNASKWERIVYLAKVVMLDTSGTDAAVKAARIHELLQDNLTIAPVGYVVRKCERQERVRYIEIDDLTNTRWQHRGGQYELLAAPLPPVIPILQ